MSTTSLCVEALCLSARASLALHLYGDTENTAELNGDAHDCAYSAGLHALEQIDGNCKILEGTHLWDAFCKGMDLAREADEMSRCSGCQNDSGDPCLYHD
jgi:hypothetical protein